MAEKKTITVLSLFDGISCGQLALQRAGIPVDKYYASEIDPYAIGVTRKHFPATTQLGDVTKWKNWNLPKIDLLIGGSPCQGFSNAGDGLNFEDPRSRLFFEFVKILKYYRPKYWMLENVRMKKAWQDVISSYLGVQPVLINSALVSAQNRERLYWANFPITQPEDRGICLKDIVLSDVEPVALHNLYGGFKEKSVRIFTDKSPTIRTSEGGGHIPSFVKKNLIHSKKAIAYMNRKVKDGRDHWDFNHYSDIRNDKSAVVVVANFFKGVPYNVFKDWNCIRKFDPIECERLQTLPEFYTEIWMQKGMPYWYPVSPTQRYKMIGNGWTVDVVAHIFECMKLQSDF